MRRTGVCSPAVPDQLQPTVRLITNINTLVDNQHTIADARPVNDTQSETRRIKKTPDAKVRVHSGSKRQAIGEDKARAADSIFTIILSHTGRGTQHNKTSRIS